MRDRLEKKRKITLAGNTAAVEETETDLMTAKKNAAAKESMAAELADLGLAPPAIARLLNLEDERK